MAYILHIETTSTVCSVTISFKDEIISHKEINGGYSHAENLHIFINQILVEAKLKITQIEAVSISKGPGSYTGLRIGYATAKGLCYSLNIPLIAIDTLQALSFLAKNKNNSEIKNAIFCPLIDARRMEVYCALYNNSLTEIEPAKALIIDEKQITELIEKYSNLIFFGDGMPKTKEFIVSLNKNATYIYDILPTSKALVSLAYSKFEKNEFENIAYAEPFYLKEFFFATKQK